MVNVTWGRAAAGLLAVTVVVSGCAHRQGGEAAAPATPAQQAQRTADAAARQAAAADRQLAESRKRLEAARQGAIQADQQRVQARQQVAQADQRAAAAQQRIGQEQSEVARLEVAARQEHQAATDAAVQAQLAAEQEQGLQTVTGRIAQASPDRLVLETPDGGTRSFPIAPGTRVLLGTAQRSVADLQQGAEARVAYDPRQAEPSAVVIHVTAARNGRAPAAPPQQATPPAPAPQR